MADTDEGTSTSVMALVLTYNAPADVAMCLEALSRQTAPPDEVLIVDNHSPEPLAEVDAGVPLRVLRLPENVGPAGGFAAGMHVFLASRCRYLWVMDDDVRPEPGCLDRLLASAAQEESPCFFVPQAIDLRTGRRFFDYGWWGMLLPRAAVAEAGVPRQDLFWGAEDQEYFVDRLPQAGFGRIEVSDAAIVLNTRDPNRGVPPWKYYYQVRNQTFRYFHDQPHLRAGPRVKRWLYRMRQYGIRLIREENHRAQKARFAARGLRDGFLGRMGKQVDAGDGDRPDAGHA